MTRPHELLSAPVPAPLLDVPAPRAPLPRFPWQRLFTGTALVVDLVVAGVLAVLVFHVHDLSYMLSHPFWADEGWVVISTKLPLSDLLKSSSVTPVGWSLVLHYFPGRGAEHYRVLPLIFAAGGVVAAVALARSLPWRRRWLRTLACVGAGLAVLLIPSSLLRDDLKQYTADAFVALIVYGLMSRLESQWSRGRLAAVGAAGAVGFLFSVTAVFVSIAAFGSLLLVALGQRRWRRAVEVASFGGATGALLLLAYVTLYLPGLPPGVQVYWADYYVPIDKGIGPSWHFLAVRTHELNTQLGMGALKLVLPLMLVGVLTLFRLKRPAVALVVPVLLAEMVVMSSAKQYPLFDFRTSHFLTVSFAVLTVIGVLGVVELVTRRVRLLGPVLAAGTIALAVLFVSGAQTYVDAQPLPKEDIRTATQYVQEHRKPNDIIVVSELSSWGFAYYWKGGQPVRQPDDLNLQGFITTLADQPRIIFADDRTQSAISTALDKAIAMQHATPGGARIWVVHEHYRRPEQLAFWAAFTAHDLSQHAAVGHTVVLLAPVNVRVTVDPS